MISFRRAGRAPADVRAATGGERVLAWGRDQAGDPVAATMAALYLPAGPAEFERIGYEQIETATWEDPALVVLLSGRRGRRFVVQLDQPGELPPTIRERVTSTIALTERVVLAGGAGARVTARRAPGSDELAWTVRFDDGVDPADPAVRTQADAAIAALRSSTGL